MPKKKSKKKKINLAKKINLSLSAFWKNPSFIIYYLLAIAFIGFHVFFANRIIPGVYVNSIDVGGLKADEAYKIINSQITFQDSVTINLNDQFQSELTADSIEFRLLPVETTQAAFNIGRSGNFITDFKNKFLGAFKITQINLEPIYSYNEDLMRVEIIELKNAALVPMAETHFEIQDDQLEIIQGNVGETFDEANFKDEIYKAMSRQRDSEIYIEVFDVSPKLTIADLDQVKDDVAQYLDVDYKFTSTEQTWLLTDEEMLNLIEPVKLADGSVNLDINALRLTTKIQEIALEVDRNPRGQVLEVEDGKAVQFVSSLDGQKLKLQDSVNKAMEEIKNKNSEIALVIEVTNPPESENEFGINEVLGVGSSRFKGSIANRIHNIGLASSRVNGVLVPPDGVFSFNEAVGPINRSTGYTSAWVISKGRTILGDGGGVCQVSTTVFRAALDAGLPIVERNAHSYRVGYYEQDSAPGIDATIYRPSVDLKFKNDTPGYILVSSEFDEENTSLIYKIYGTDDGRIVEMTEPVVTSRISPPAPTYIDDGSLPKGTTRQVEYAVYGASVSFDRTVKKDDQILYDDTFKSYYRAWGAVYNVGTAE